MPVRPGPSADSEQSELENRRQQLEKWKEEKEKKKKAASKKKKPFVAGVVHAPLTFVPPSPPPKPMPCSSGRVTRSQSSRASAKPKEAKDTRASQSFRASAKPNEAKNTLVKLPTIQMAPEKKEHVTWDPMLPEERSPILVTRAPQNSPRLTTKTTRKFVQPKSVEDFNSSCVIMSRGKDNERKEMKKKLGLLAIDVNVSNVIDSVDHFRRQLASEIKRMTEMCETWDKVLQQTVLPHSVQETALSAVDQARLLMSQELQQFASLVEQCARPESLVTPADLHCFWDMVLLQVKDIDMRFKKLEELRLGGWVQKQPVEVKKEVINPAVKAKKAAKPAGGPSRLKEFAPARKIKKEPEECLAPPKPVSKTFDAGLSSERSPRTQSGSGTFLRAVLSSEAKKASASKNSASLPCLKCVSYVHQYLARMRSSVTDALSYHKPQ